MLLQRAALPPFLVLALTLTLVLALVRNIIIFSKVRVLVLNQPIIIVVVVLLLLLYMMFTYFLIDF